MPYYTQCPACATVYQFQPASLESSQGQARCGTCHAVFDAYAQVYEQLPPLPAHAPPDVSALWGTPATGTTPFGTPTAVLPNHPPPLQHAPERLAWLTETDLPPQPPGRWIWRLAGALLALTLLGQLSYGERLWLHQHYPATRPALTEFCRWLGCSLPAPPTLEAWKILHREVGPHPGQAEAWLAEVSFLNDGINAQPYPILELVLLDERGLAYAGRRFHAHEYLPPSEGSPANTVAPQAIVFARLALRAPTPPASGFRFQFHAEP